MGHFSLALIFPTKLSCIRLALFIIFSPWIGHSLQIIYKSKVKSIYLWVCLCTKLAYQFDYMDSLSHSSSSTILRTSSYWPWNPAIFLSLCIFWLYSCFCSSWRFFSWRMACSNSLTLFYYVRIIYLYCSFSAFRVWRCSLLDSSVLFFEVF